MGDAHRLRTLAHRLTRKEHVNPPFPNIDVSGFETAPVRALYTLADVDDFARSNPGEKLVGYLSVILTGLDIVAPLKRNMLMCNECCGVPVFANAGTAECGRCGKAVSLRVNPRIVCTLFSPSYPPSYSHSHTHTLTYLPTYNYQKLGPIIDETGQISSGKLILSDAAWEQLLGRTVEQLVATGLDVLRYLEQRLLLLRVTMGFAMDLEDGVGRLAVWGVGN